MGITYNEPLVTYRDPAYTYSGTLVAFAQSFTARARIAVLSTPTVQFRSRIANAGLSLIDMRGRIAATVNQGLTSQGRIAALTTQNLQARARIADLSSATFTSRGRIVLSGNRTFSALASIKTPCASYNQAGVTYNDPGRSYWGCLGSTLQTFTMRAFILAAPKSIQMRAFILGPRTLSMRTRISRQQGWPIPNPVDPSFPSFQPTQLTMRSNITQGSLSNQTMQMQANIFKGSTHLMSAKGRIVLNHQLTMRANIRPRISSRIVKMTYEVARASRTLVTMLFYTQGNLGIQGMSMGARIVKRRRTEVTGHFIVFNQQVPSSVIPFNFRAGVPTTDQQFGMRANVVRP